MNPNTTDEAVRCRTATEVASRVTAEPGLGVTCCAAPMPSPSFCSAFTPATEGYYLTTEGRAQLPHFRLGTIICARKSTLLRWIEAAEARGSGSGQA